LKFPNERDHFGVLGFNSEIDIKETGCEIMEQAPPYHGRIQWQSLVNTKLNIPISENADNTFIR
jgi:hypothetical protein